MTGDSNQQPTEKRTRAYNAPKLNAEMDARGFDAIVASSPWNASYLSGISIREDRINFTNPIFLVTARDGRQGLVINEADASFVRNDSNLADVRSFPFSDTTAVAASAAIDVVVEMLEDMGLARSRLGTEDDFLPAAYRERLGEMLPDTTLGNGSAVLNEARIYKTADEIEIMRRAAYYTDKAIYMGFAQARPGDTERDIAAMIQYCMLRLGGSTMSHTVCSAGVQSTVVHALPLNKPVRVGEVIHVDFGGMFDAYQTDLSRNAIVGEPSPQQRNIYGTLSEIHQEILASIRPGVVARDIFRMADESFEARGLAYPWGTLGHSTGLLVHEGFEITRTSDRVIEVGMILNVEPTHIERDDARYHIEDTILVIEDGIEILSNYADTRSMYVIR